MCAAPALVSIGDEGVLNAEVSPSLSEVWIDRDLGWLDFNERVLAEGIDERTPLLERAKFLAIFTSNLDEFFMKRIAAFRKTPAAERVKLLEKLREKLIPSLRRQSDCFRQNLVPELEKNGVCLRRWDQLTHRQQDEARRYFDSEVSPALTPLVFDPAHPFPFLSNLSTSIAFLLRDEQRSTSMYARVKVPTVLRQWVSLVSEVASGQKLLVPLHEVILGNIYKLYRGMTLEGATLFRVTLELNRKRPDRIRRCEGLVWGRAGSD
jgi:polyphosphate kinase